MTLTSYNITRQQSNVFAFIVSKIVLLVAKHHDTETETQTFDLQNYVNEQDVIESACKMISLLVSK